MALSVQENHLPLPHAVAGQTAEVRRGVSVCFFLGGGLLIFPGTDQ